jgi:anaerobic magnesium-protoporphyrin IX monomethyl ester cyclase
MPPVAVRMPNGALTSLAGNVDDHHRVAVADLILSHRRVQETINKLFHEFDPEVVGLSVMTFQRRTANRIIDLARALKRDVKIVMGGYDPSLAPEAYEGMGVDYIVRGEGEVTFRELLRALERGGGFENICGLSRCKKKTAESNQPNSCHTGDPLAVFAWV